MLMLVKFSLYCNNTVLCEFKLYLYYFPMLFGIAVYKKEPETVIALLTWMVMFLSVCSEDDTLHQDAYLQFALFQVLPHLLIVVP